MIDLLIIGAGLTGLFAAYRAAQAGLQVRVIAKGIGATHWHAGTVDVLGYLPGQEAAVVDWKLAIQELPAAHPYQLLGVEAIQTALDAFQQLTADAGLPYERAGAPGYNHLLPSPLGVGRPVYLVPVGQRAGDLTLELPASGGFRHRRATQVERPLVIVGLSGIRDFYPALIAENLQKQGYRVRSAMLPCSLLTKRQGQSPLQLARLLDVPAEQERFAEAVASIAVADERLGLPAVLGLHNHSRLMARLQEASGNRSIFEIPTLPPSVPGIRLYEALRARLYRLGVRIEVGMEVCGVYTEGRRIQWLETETSSRPLHHRASKYLLASGGILGGGMRGDHSGRMTETVFDLPLTVPRDRSQWLRPLFLDSRGHPVFQGGVAVNARFQPLDASAVPVYENLWAAGAILSHTDPIRERSREGVAIATGYAAIQQLNNCSPQGI